MKALCWHGTGDVRIDSVPDPKIRDPRDAGRRRAFGGCPERLSSWKLAGETSQMQLTSECLKFSKLSLPFRPLIAELPGATLYRLRKSCLDRPFVGACYHLSLLVEGWNATARSKSCTKNFIRGMRCRMIPDWDAWRPEWPSPILRQPRGEGDPAHFGSLPLRPYCPRYNTPYTSCVRPRRAPF
jgi:hypothetical protein